MKLQLGKSINLIARVDQIEVVYENHEIKLVAHQFVHQPPQWRSNRPQHFKIISRRKQTKKAPTSIGAVISIAIKLYRLLTSCANFDFWLAALLLWIILFFANLSIMPETVLKSSSASALSVVDFNFLMKVLVVLC